MSKKITCPYCFHEFKNTEVEFQCENREKKLDQTDKCPEKPDVRFNEHWGKEENYPSRHFFKGHAFNLFGSGPRPCECDVCHTPSSKYVCPNCHNWLPKDMISEGSEIISIIGAPKSGKTVYFFTLMQQLAKYGYKVGITVTPQDEGPDKDRKTSVIYSRICRQMFDDLEVPEKTNADQSARVVPLIFRVSSRKKDNKGGKAIYIVFYDTAGEAFEDSEMIRNMARHVERSSGILFFVDPFNIKSLYDTVNKKEVDGLETMKSDSHKNVTVLQSLMQSVDEKTTAGHPFAVVFSKIDAVLNGLESEGDDSLRQNGLDMSNNSSFLKTGKLNLTEVDTISEALERLADEKWDIGAMKHSIREKFSEDDIRMFGVSSIGSQPLDGIQIQGEMRPYRVMDPLVWMLHRMGGFDIPVE